LRRFLFLDQASEHIMNRWFIFLALVAAPAAAQNMEWKNIFVSDCEAGVHLAPNSPLEMNMNGQTIKMAINVFENGIKIAAQKGCPDLTDDDFMDWIMPNLQWGLKYTLNAEDRKTNRDKFVAKCPNLSKGGFDHLLGLYKDGTESDDGDVDQLAKTARDQLPTSCTHERFMTDGCAMAIKLPSLGVEFQMTIAKCGSGTVIPFAKVQCRGDGCVDLWKPCDADADCGGSANTAVVCTPIAVSGQVQ
jgi:hypothetical protein